MRTVKYALSVMALSGVLGVSGAQADTLKEAIQTAYSQNPQLAAQRKQTAQAQEQLSQARAAWRPQVTASGSYGYESIDTTRTFALDIGDRPIATAQLQATQPVYAGGRIKSGIRQAKAGIGAANAQLEGTGQDLILQVVTAYVDVLRDRETITIRQNSVELLERQLTASQDRFDVGVVTRTDVAQSQARLEGAKAALASAEAALESSESFYTFLVGGPADDLTPVPPVPALPQSVEEAIAAAFSDSPDLQASRLNEQIANEGVKSAYGALKPSLSVVATAGLFETYVNDFRDTSVSAVAQASVPLFEGGLIRSQVRSAKLERDAARFQTENVERQIRAQVAQAFFAHQAALKAIEASERQVEAAEIAFDGAREELRAGVRTTLDLLDQEQQLLEARLSLVSAQRDAYVAAHQLLRVMGALQFERLNLDVEAYDPDNYGDFVRRNWLLTDVE
ncbi:MAG: TolC family outer membrane protein [Pseudomonadota bacterium]